MHTHAPNGRDAVGIGAEVLGNEGELAAGIASLNNIRMITKEQEETHIFGKEVEGEDELVNRVGLVGLDAQLVVEGALELLLQGSYVFVELEHG